jgi:hypothetical protein
VDLFLATVLLMLPWPDMAGKHEESSNSVAAQSAYSFQHSDPRKAGAGASPSRIEPPAATYRFPEHQTYFYSADWRMMSAGTASLRTQTPGETEQMITTADTSGMVNLLFPVHDQFKAKVDPRTFCSQGISKHTEERSRRRDVELRFDYARGKSVFNEKNLKTGVVKHLENDIPECVVDIISGFYYVGSLLLNDGAVYTFPMNDGGQTNDIIATVEAHERLKTPAGNFMTARVHVEPKSGALKSKGQVWAWYSVDAPHTPVQVRVRVLWGTLTFHLTRIERQ